MQAIVASGAGGPEVLQQVERPDPEPAPGELLVRVVATAVNRADILQRQGRYPPPEGVSDVLGLELVGEVVELGHGVEGWSPGDPVCAVVGGGGYAEQALVPASCALPAPEGVDLLLAAAVPEVFTTAYDNLVNRARILPGETVLVHGGAGGVGTAAIQLAVRRDCRVVATARSAERLARCAELGAEAGINHTSEDFVERVRELTSGAGADAILDVVGGDYLQRNLEALALEGRLAVIGMQGGRRGELDLALVLSRRLTITGSTLRARGEPEKAALAAQMAREVWPGFADGSLRPVVDRVLPLAEAAEAHRAMEAGEHVGKIVLQVA